MNGFRIPRPLGVNGLSVLSLGEMNGFGLHVIPMVGLILLSWLGLRSLGMERGAPPAAPGWPSGCTFPEVELPGGQSSQAATNPTLYCEAGLCRTHAAQSSNEQAKLGEAHTREPMLF